MTAQPSLPTVLDFAATQHPPAERWLPVVGYEGSYEVSDLGRVRSVDRTVECRDGRARRLRGVVLAQLDRGDKIQVALSANGISRFLLLHHLVLTAFVSPRPDGLNGCHENGDHHDNWPSNLRWDTQSNNMLDKQRHGTDHHRNKTHCPIEHKLVAPNLCAAKARTGHRACLACDRAHANQQEATKRGRHFDFRTAADEHYRRIMGVAA